MTNQLMPLFKQDMLSDYLTGATLKMILVDTADHAFNAADEFLDDITGGAIVATSPSGLTGVTYALGVLDGTVPAFTSVTGDESEALYLFIDTTVASTSRLIAYWDTATGLAITPDGNNINVTVATSLFSL